MCALDPRGQQNTAGEAGSPPRWPRAGDKRDTDSGLFTGWGRFQGCCLGGSEDAAGEVRHTASLGKDPSPSRLGTRAHPGLVQGLFCMSET